MMEKFRPSINNFVTFFSPKRLPSCEMDSLWRARIPFLCRQLAFDDVRSSLPTCRGDNQANGVKTIDSTHTTPTTSKSSTVDKSITDANGSKQVETPTTGPNGKTVTSDQTSTKERKGKVTRTTTGSITGPNGDTKLIGPTETYDKTVTPSTPPID